MEKSIENMETDVRVQRVKIKKFLNIDLSEDCW